MPDILCFQIEDLKVTVGYLASKLLSKEEKSGLRFEKLIVAAQSNLLDRSVQISELLDINDSLSGELKVLSSLDHNFTFNFFYLFCRLLWIRNITCLLMLRRSLWFQLNFCQKKSLIVVDIVLVQVYWMNRKYERPIVLFFSRFVKFLCNPVVI